MKLPLNGKENVRCTVNCSRLAYHGHYVLMGDPVPLARARFGNGKVWDCQKETKVSSGIVLANQHGKAPRFEDALHVELWFHFPIPKSISIKKKQDLIGKPHRFKPDLSNLIKFIEDVGNDILYHDDARIAILNAYKVYGVEPRTELIVMEL